MLLKSIAAMAGSIFASAGVLLPGATIAVDLCKWVAERAMLVRGNRQAAEKLQAGIATAGKNLKRHFRTLKACEQVLKKLAANAVLDEDDVADFEEALEDLRVQLPAMWGTLTRAGQLSSIASRSGSKKLLRQFCAAKNVCWLGCLFSRFSRARHEQIGEAMVTISTELTTARLDIVETFTGLLSLALVNNEQMTPDCRKSGRKGQFACNL